MKGNAKTANRILDPDIRVSTLGRISQRYRNHSDTFFIEELGIREGRSRVDIAVINGHLHGYEIKSEADSVRRLESQAFAYSLIFDYATLVLAEKHLRHAEATIPDWWEIILARPQKNTRVPRLTQLRRGKLNPDINPRAVVELLWYEDAIEILRQKNATRGLIGKPRAVLWNRLCDLSTPAEISQHVCRKLKARKDSLSVPRPS